MKTSIYIIIVLIVSLAAAATICDASCLTPSDGKGLRTQAANDVLVTIRVTHILTGEPLPDMYVQVVDPGCILPFWCGYTCRNGCCDFLLYDGEFLANVHFNNITWPCVFKISPDMGSDRVVLIDIPINPDIG